MIFRKIHKKKISDFESGNEKIVMYCMSLLTL